MLFTKHLAVKFAVDAEPLLRVTCPVDAFIVSTRLPASSLTSILYVSTAVPLHVSVVVRLLPLLEFGLAVILSHDGVTSSPSSTTIGAIS